MGRYYNELVGVKKFDDIRNFAPNFGFFEDYVNAAEKNDNLKNSGSSGTWKFYDIAKAVVEGKAKDSNTRQKVCDYLNKRLKSITTDTVVPTGKQVLSPVFDKHKEARECVSDYFYKHAKMLRKTPVINLSLQNKKFTPTTK